MLIRIRWRDTREDDAPRFRNEALAVASLLAPSAVLAFTIFFWSISSDLRWTSAFFVSRGLFSHWQVWLASSAALLGAARLLNRYARADEHTE